MARAIMAEPCWQPVETLGAPSHCTIAIKPSLHQSTPPTHPQLAGMHGLVGGLLARPWRCTLQDGGGTLT